METIGDISVPKVIIDMQWINAILVSGEYEKFGLTSEQLVALRDTASNLVLATNEKLESLNSKADSIYHP